MITGPRACLHARCFFATSSPCSRCAPNVLPSSVVFSSKKEEPAVSLSSSLDLSITLAGDDVCGVDQSLRRFRVDDDERVEPRCLFFSLAAIAADGLLRLSLLTNSIADSSLRHGDNVIDHPRSCVSQSSLIETFLPTRRFCSMYARGFVSPLFLALSSFVLDFSSEGKGEGLPFNDVGPPNDATAESRKMSYDDSHRSRGYVSNCLFPFVDHCCCWFQATTTRTSSRVVARVRARALPRYRLPGGARGARCHRPPCVRADRRLYAGTHDCASPSLDDEDRWSARSQLVAWCRDEATQPATSTQILFPNPINRLLSTSTSGL